MYNYIEVIGKDDTAIISKKNKIFCLLGKSGTGKDTIARMLLEDKELNLKPLIPYTTRPKRPNETEGLEYHFVSNQEMDELKAAGKVVESREYPHYVDGSVTYATVDDVEEGSNYLLITTPEAYPTILKYYRNKFISCVDIYVSVDPVERLKRCFEREEKTEGNKYKELIRRFLADEEDYKDLKQYEITNTFQNYDLETTVNDIKGFILGVTEGIRFPISSEEQNGFANGHDRFMLTNIKEQELPSLARFFSERLKKDCELLSGFFAKYNIPLNRYSIEFEGNGSRYRNSLKPLGDNDMLKIISKAFPSITCYWCDCWDYPLDFSAMINGCQYAGYTLSLDNIQKYDDSGDFFDVDMTLFDTETGETMTFGGGMIDRDSVERFFDENYKNLDENAFMKYLEARVRTIGFVK